MLSLSFIYSNLLGIDSKKIGIQDDFFSLGGDSIISIQLSSKIRKDLGIFISIKDIFENKTIEKLYDNVISKMIENTNKKIIQTEQGLLEGTFELLPIQKWFFTLDLKNKNYWNQSFLIQVPKLDLEKIKLCFIKLIEQHDSLRLKFKKINNNYHQFYDNRFSIDNIKILNINDIKI